MGTLFWAISESYTGTKELYAYIRLKVMEFIRFNGAHIQDVEAYLKQLNMEKNCVWDTENEIFCRDLVVYSSMKLITDYITNQWKLSFWVNVLISKIPRGTISLLWYLFHSILFVYNAIKSDVYWNLIYKNVFLWQ